MVGTLRDPLRPADEELKVGTRKRPSGAGEMAPPAATGGDPARAASMQAQMSQPVYKGEAGVKETQRQAELQRGRDFSDAIQHEADRAVASAQDGQFAKTGPATPGIGSRAVDYVQGVGQLAAGVVSAPATTAIDLGRAGIAWLDGSELANPNAARDVSGKLMYDGVNNIGQAFDGSKGIMRDLIGATPVADSQGLRLKD